MFGLTKRFGFGLFASLLFIAFTALGVHATTIHVPADQPTIQAAINAASDGDTVLVAPGTYYENIDFMGKAITVTSSGGPSVTTIDGSARDPVVVFDTGEGRSSVLSELTITHGDNSYFGGGGISISGASPTISGNVITDNVACFEGGGILADGSSALIQGNTITNNGLGEGCSGGGGGGVAVGGGGGSVQIIGNTIRGNTWDSGDGGGIYLGGAGTATIEDNTVSGNSASGITPYSAGGGIYIDGYSDVLILQNLIINNNVGDNGRDGDGGGVYFRVPNGQRGPYLINNTIANNQGDGGSGVYASGYDRQVELLNNTIIASSGQPALYCDSLNSTTPPIVQFDDAFSSGGNGFDGTCAGMSGSNGNISSDPLFLDGARNFHLQFGSPAIDAGSNNAPSLPSTDFDGDPRIVNGTVDMGVYEFFPTTVALSPTNLNFGSVAAGTTSSPQDVTVTNTGSQKLFLAVAVDANFTETNNCGGVVGPSANCTISVSFAPTTTGAIAGDLTLRDNAPGSPQTVRLSGTGGTPTADLTPTSLTFASRLIGTTSTAQDVTLSNNGNVSLTISNIMTTGDFSETDNCGTTVVNGGSCTISITFTPAGGGTRTGSLAVTDDAAGSPQTVTLSGTGTGPGASLAPTGLTFSPQRVGTTSSAQQVTLTNNGTTSLSISGVATTGDFAQTNNCGTSLAVGANCSVSVTFAPTTSGTQTGSLTFTDGAATSPQTVPLDGTGTAPVASLNPTSLSFGDQLVGAASAAKQVTLTNSGNAALSISSIATTGDFAETDNCGTSLAPGANCSVSVTFTPTASGTRTGSLTFMDGAANSPQSVSLSGTGTGPVASLAQTSLQFSSQLVGTTSAAQQVKLTNSGNAALSIVSIVTTGDFAQANNCGSSLAAGANCSVSVTFTPTAGGTRKGSLTLTDNAPDSPQKMALSATGEDFTVGIASGSSSTATVTAGGTATYSVSVAPEGGFNQAVSISCSGAPSLATCTASPASVTPDGTNPAQVSITVSTTASSAIPPGPAPAAPSTGEKFLLLGAGLVLLAILGSLARRQPRRAWLGLALTLALIGMLAACGGGGPTPSTGGGSHTPGTPTGTYSLTVSGSDGSLTHSTTLNLTVH